jgi:DNA-binding CsgD family transcriptional regulator
MCVTLGFACSEFGHLFLQSVEETGSGLAVMDRFLRITETNKAFREHSGHSRELRHRRLPELLHPAVRGRVTAQFERLADSRHRRFEERLPALWPTCTRRREWDVTGLTVPGPGGRAGTFVLLAAPEDADGDGDSCGIPRPRRMLKPTDARILEGIATGETTVQLAAGLHLSRQGVEYHIGRMLRQFRVTNRTALVSKAHSTGLFGVGAWPPRILPEYVTPD